MTKLEELIQKLCPDGVEHKPLNEVSEMKRGTSITKKDIVEGEIPVVSGGREPAYYCDKYNRDGETITVAGSGAGAGYVQYWTKPIFVCDAFSIQGNPGIQTKYIYYFLTNIQDYIYSTKKGGGVPHVHISSIENVSVPVPPLPVQREIVRILDNFTELTAELTARKQQYAYYRDKLLTFGDVRVGVTSDVIRRTLGEVCKISAGGDAPKNSMSKQKTEKYSVPIISNGIGENALYGYTDAPKVEEPAVTVAARGTIGYAEYRDYPFYPIIRLLTAIPKDSTVVNTKYLYYCLQGKQYSVPMGGIPQLTAPELKKVEIPIPSLDVQNRIVQVLDNFDAICTDLNIGLPAEIEARQKQYEYYRDKLLTFTPADCPGRR